MLAGSTAARPSKSHGACHRCAIAAASIPQPQDELVRASVYVSPSTMSDCACRSEVVDHAIRREGPAGTTSNLPDEGRRRARYVPASTGIQFTDRPASGQRGRRAIQRDLLARDFSRSLPVRNVGGNQGSSQPRRLLAAPAAPRKHPADQRARQHCLRYQPRGPRVAHSGRLLPCAIASRQRRHSARRQQEFSGGETRRVARTSDERSVGVYATTGSYVRIRPHARRLPAFSSNGSRSSAFRIAQPAHDGGL